ncbi:hypothetical protein EMIT0P74_240029 [Pseudomonas sp. IT-P74]
MRMQWMRPGIQGAAHFKSCRSEPARDVLKNDAFIQSVCVIVDVHREQARSYSVLTLIGRFRVTGYGQSALS